jgi:hypothetical protein
MSSSSRGKGGCINLKPEVARQFSFVKTPKNRVSSAKGVHLAEILLRVTKTEKCTRCLQDIVRCPF